MRRAFTKGLDQGGLSRARRSWVFRSGPIRWVAHVDDRKWAGLALEASLFLDGDGSATSGPLLTMFLETLPMSDTVERKQALYPQSAITDQVRAERLESLGREFAELICGLDSIEAVRDAETKGLFSYGFVSPSLGEILARARK